MPEWLSLRISPTVEVTVGVAMSDSWGRQRLLGTAILTTNGRGQQGLGDLDEAGRLKLVAREDRGDENQVQYEIVG